MVGFDSYFKDKIWHDLIMVLYNVKEKWPSVWGIFGIGGAIYCYGSSGLVLVWKRLRIVAMHNLKCLLNISYVDWATSCLGLWT